MDQNQKKLILNDMRHFFACIISFILLCLLFNVESLFADTTIPEVVADSEKTSWVLAASEFSVNKDSLTGADIVIPESLHNLAKLLPTLILTNIKLPALREVTSEELIARRKDELQKKYASLISSYNSQIAKRDQLVITEKTNSDYDEQLKKSDEDISNFLEAIQKNKKEQQSFLNADFTTVFEKVAFYNENATNLYTLPKTGEPENINALLTGSLSLIDDYIQAQIKLIQYPGGKELYSQDFLFTFTEMKQKSSEIANALLFVIQQKKTAQVEITVLPKEITNKTQIRIDGELVSLDENNSIWLTRNVHKITFSSDGYSTLKTQADFTIKDKYEVQVNLKKSEKNVIKIESDIPLEKLYVNGKEYNPNSEITISTLPALGQAFDFSETSTFLMLADEGTVNVNLNTEDMSLLIEKRRRTMYNSYGALLLSLPFSFISYGMYIDANYSAYSYGSANGYDTTYIDLVEKQDNLKNYSDIFKYVSIGLGVNVVIQLVRYIMAVDKILPENLKTKDSTQN